MKKEIKLGTITLFIVGLIFLPSCTTNKICSKPTRREIKKAMSYSTWKYVVPSIKN